MSELTSLSLLIGCARARTTPPGCAWSICIPADPWLAEALRRCPNRTRTTSCRTSSPWSSASCPNSRSKPQIGAFRRWLRNDHGQLPARAAGGPSVIGRRRPATASSAKILDQLEDPESALSKLWDHEHDLHVTRRLLEKIRPRFEAKTWQAFQRVALEGAPVDQAARSWRMSVNAIFIAKLCVIHAVAAGRAGIAGLSRRPPASLADVLEC